MVERHRPARAVLVLERLDDGEEGLCVCALDLRGEDHDVPDRTLGTRIGARRYDQEVDGPLLGRIGLRRLDLVVLALGGLGELGEGHRCDRSVSCGRVKSRRLRIRLGLGCTVSALSEERDVCGEPFFWQARGGVVVEW